MASEYSKASTPNQHRAEPKVEKPRSAFMKVYDSVFGVIIGALIGIGIGIFIQQVLDPDDSGVAEFISWYKLPGDLFINALKCLVAPLVFCSLVTGMADMLNVGKASSIGWRTAVAYTLTTIIASVEGLILVLIFRDFFGDKDKSTADTSLLLAFQCNSDVNATATYLIQEEGTNNIICGQALTSNTSAQYLATDLNGVLQKKSGYAKLSLSESLQAQFKQMVPSNITAAFAEANLLSIVMFAMPFGVALALLPSASKGKSVLLHVFRELNLVFMTMIKGCIFLTPIAVIFLIGGALAGQSDMVQLLKDVGTLILTVFLGLILHTGFVLPGILFAVIRSNPFKYLQHVIPAQIFALGCASSMATLPVTMQCVDATKQVSKTLSRFVLSLGATINMDGSALYYPAAIVFMAETAGLGDMVGGVEMFLIIVVSTVGAVGSAPVPSAGIVMTITIWNSVFPGTDVPSASFAYIVATDWLTDRFITATNVTGDTIIARIIAELVDETTVEEERESINSLYEDGYLVDKPELQDDLDLEKARNSMKQ